MFIKEYQKKPYRISTDREELDLEFIHGYLSRSYWAEGIPIQTVKKSIKHSLCFGLFDGDRQIGFARLITDYTTYAYLADVFIIEKYQGQGLGKWLIDCITSEPELQGLRRWGLATLDAHGLYARYGFKPLQKPEVFMEINRPGIYIES